MKPWSPLVFALACLVAPTPALGQNADRDGTDVLGGWSFETDPYREGSCVMNGVMRLSPDPEPGVYACELTAVEVCDGLGLDRSVVVQRCVAQRLGDKIAIRSSIEQFLESHNLGLTYVPDNFSLTVETPRRMVGSLISAVSAPVEFRREEDAVS